MTDALSYTLYFAYGKTSSPKATTDYQPHSFLVSLAGSDGMIASMSGAGNCFDNAAMESFFHTLKTELVRFEYYFTRALRVHQPKSV